jgi:hypothetical protein
MKKLLVLAAVVVIAWLGVRWGRDRFGSALSSDDAERRVRVVLAGMKDGGDEQAAASMFLDGVMTINEEARLTMAYDRWMQWRRAEGLGQPVSSFSLDGVDASGDVVVAEVTIDGRALRIGVPAKGQLTWEE